MRLRYEKAGVRYMQRWEELAYAREDGKAEGEAKINKLGILLKEGPVETLIAFVPVEYQFQKLSVVIAQICGFGVEILIRLEHDHAEHSLLLIVRERKNI